MGRTTSIGINGLSCPVDRGKYERESSPSGSDVVYPVCGRCLLSTDGCKLREAQICRCLLPMSTLMWEYFVFGLPLLLRFAGL